MSDKDKGEIENDDDLRKKMQMKTLIAILMLQQEKAMTEPAFQLMKKQ